MDIQTKREAILREFNRGTDRNVIASMFGLSLNTVNDIIRQFRHKESGNYSHVAEVISGGYLKQDINAWAHKQLANLVRTPEGTMTVAAVYPYIMSLIGKNGRKVTYTNQEIYYMNRR